ncbi:MAG TPA: SusD/RagB family nutrient-binding outer membrane lipoprotein [Mucilaginibacter sp.]
MSNYASLVKLMAAAPDTSVYTNVKAMLKTLKAYQAIKLSNFFGDMPYSQAGGALDYGSGNDTVFTPVYDKQQSIYLSCLADLQWAVDHFSTGSQYSLGSSEFVLQGNIPKWIEFANSLRLRIAITMYDKDASDATPYIKDALSKPLLDADSTNVGLYPDNIPAMELQARKYAFGTECRLRMGTTMWNLMSSTNAQDGSGIFDPRCTIYFEPNNDNLWNPFPQNPTPSTPAEAGSPYNYLRDQDWANKDGDPPTPNLYANFNYYWGHDVDIPELFMTAAEVHFLKAEVYARGLAGIAANAATAQTEYNAGIVTSVRFWTQQAIHSAVWVVNKPAGPPSAAALNTLLTNPKVAYNVANGPQLIYAQEWIDMFRQPWEAWTLQKRTGGLTPTDPVNAAFYTQTYGSYNRYQYPTTEQTYNFNNWYAETKNSDLTSTKIWIAK